MAAETARDPGREHRLKDPVLAALMDIPYGRLAEQIDSGDLRRTLQAELIEQFEKLRESGEAVQPSSWYASKIAEILDSQSEQPLDQKHAFELYQEVAIACENAQREVFGADELGRPLRNSGKP